jgi:hypothetical protein
VVDQRFVNIKQLERGVRSVMGLQFVFITYVKNHVGIVTVHHFAKIITDERRNAESVRDLGFVNMIR